MRPVVQPVTTHVVRQVKDELTQIDVSAASSVGSSPPSFDFSKASNSQNIPLL